MNRIFLTSLSKDSQFKHALILSMMWHGILIAMMLIYSSIYKTKFLNSRRSSDDSGGAINVLMVNSSVVTTMQHHDKHQKNAPPLPSNNQMGNLQKKQVVVGIENQRKNALRKEEEPVVVTPVTDKTKTNQGNKQNMPEKKEGKGNNNNQRILDDLLSSLCDNNPSNHHSKKKEASKAEIQAYEAVIKQAISNKFYDAYRYRGKTCNLSIKLSPDGTLSSITATTRTGDPELCHAALSAARLAKIPKPPNARVYEVFKDATITFSPQ